MRRIVPHPYQSVDADDICLMYRESQRAAAIYCTGAGKTILGTMVSAKTMGTAWKEGFPRFSHILVIAPSKVIRDAFIQQYLIEDGDETYVTPVVENVALTPRGLSTYLELEWPNKIACTTHSNFNSCMNALAARGSQWAAGKLLIFDEAQHGGELQLVGRGRAAWLRAGGSVLDLTATPDRSDKTVAIDEDVLARFCVRRSMTDQMADGLAPERLLSDILWVDGNARHDHATILEPIEPDVVAAKLIAHMEADNWPKSTVRLKNAGSFNVHDAVISAVVRAADARGLRIFVASDTHLTNDDIRRANARTLDRIRTRTGFRGSADLSEVLAYEATIAAIDDSCVDLVIGMHTVLEGMNWEVCSHVYFLGVPQYLLPVIQGIGRTMRNRRHLPPYGPWRTASKAVFLAAGDKDELQEAHRSRMVSLACYLASFRQWSVLGSIREVFESIHYSTPRELEHVRRRVNALRVSDEKATLIHEALARTDAVFARVRMEDGPLTIRQKARLTKVFIDECLVTTDVAYSIILQKDIEQVLLTSRADAQRVFASSVRIKVARGIEITEAVAQSLDEIAEEFATKSTTPTEASEVVSDVVHTVTLDAESMLRCDAEVSDLLEDVARPVVQTRVRGVVGRAIEKLRRQ